MYTLCLFHCSCLARLAGRDIRDICEQAERKWASRILRSLERPDTLPPVELYLEEASMRKQSSGDKS